LPVRANKVIFILQNLKIMPLNSSTLITASNPKTEIEPSADYSPLMLLPVAAAVAFHYSK
jgi:hypothetical protein